MKVKQLIPFLAVSLMLSSLPLTASAESLDALKQKEAQATETGNELNKDINSALNDVNEKYAEIEKIKVDISNTEEQIKTSEAEITATEKSIERRKEAVGERMKDVQVNGDQRTLQALLEAESLSDFFNRAYAMTILQNAEREKIDKLSEDKEKLAELQETVKSKQTELTDNKAKLQEEATAMDAQVATLKDQLANNEEVLKQISTDKQTEEKRLEDEKKLAEAKKQREAEAARKAEEAALKEAEEAKKAESSTPPVTETSSGSSTDSTVQPEAPVTDVGNTTGNGKVLYMESTAYSWREAGSGYITATGIDVRTNSNVIAVDPSVIPLGSLVNVEGYGIAVAGDTGGAIKGNIIDVHFDTVDQCRIWGRRHNVRVEIL